MYIYTCDLHYIVLFYIQIYKRLFASTNIKYKKNKKNINY